MPDIERIDASIAPEEFFKSFVAKRQPVVFKSWLTDSNFHAIKWDATYLKQKAGHRELKVEPKSKKSLQFGTSEPRQRMTLSAFLDSMDEDLYLTTQYDGASDEDEDVTTISPPCDLLWDDFPLKPTLTGNLFLQQVNLWLGRSTQGSSSGLHHDSADNLYILLKGRKRFIICPPQHAEQLQPWGDLEEVHENGLISYQANPTRSDGLSKLHALELKIAALDLKIQQATHPKEAAILEDQKEEAEDELMASQLAGYRDQGDDLDALGMDSDFDEGALGELPVVEDELDDDEEEEEEEEGDTPQAKDDQVQGVKEAPDTFSRFSAAELHASLGLSDSASTLSEDQKKLRDLPFQVIELNAGEMLYLPASWWHDVTSQSDSMHVAFNYWFFPPNTTSFEQPYDDQLVWKHLEHLQATQWREKGYLKRKRSDSAIQIWKLKKLIDSLQKARGNGTSMISLVLPPRSQISQAQNMLTQEYGTASNIKSRVNRLSVLAAITSTQQRLKLHTRVPENGLLIYCGTVLTDEGKEKKVNVDIEPWRPINTSLYLCDNKFHTEALADLLESDSKFGFIIMDGNGTLFGTLSGNTREIIHKFTVDLPKKHGRGGQSALRFSRLRDEKRHNYVRKVAEFAVQHFITDDKVNVAGLVLAGSADFKTELSQSDMLDQRLAAKIVKVVDISYGGENGFNQAIELAGDALSNVKFVQEKKLIQKYFDEISLDSGRYCFGVDDTLRGLEMGAVDTLIVWEDLDITRRTLRDSNGNEVIIHTAAPPPTANNARGEDGKALAGIAALSERDQAKFIDKTTGLEMEQAKEPVSLLEWLAENYKEFGAELCFVTNKSQEGSQFVRGFGGIGGILRYRVDFAQIAEALESDSDEFMSDSDDD